MTNVQMTNPSKDLRLGDFELLLALALTVLDEGAYGAAVARVIEDRTGRVVSLGAVYKTFDRLEAKRLLTSSIGEPTAERGGRRRKLVRLTAVGERVRDQTLSDLDAMRRGLAQADQGSAV